MDRYQCRPDFWFAFPAPRVRRGLWLERRAAAVRAGLRGGLEQGHEPGSFRPRLTSKRRSVAAETQSPPGAVAKCFPTHMHADRSLALGEVRGNSPREQSRMQDGTPHCPEAMPR